ncbi:MAG: DEAD/DEAH box helicase [Candidatus Eremiobacteraeota bacterium]|nr:DEAD/DEAH box helicase [Candidatus Eremiobacteraeota bacterium]
MPLGIARRSHLICSPTGTGKTLAAFLPVFSSLAHKRDRDELFARTYALYISPLRALGYDVEHNLRGPLREMELLERPNSERGRLRRGRIREGFVRTGVRTSDTPHAERRLMLSRPPHILVTTPESLAVMLAMDSYRRTLRNVETVILDEVHALAGNKRGAHLALLLESLEELTVVPPVRVGLSATVAPLERVANFVSGGDRPCEIVDCRGLRSIRIGIEAPFTGAVAPLAVAARAALAATADVRTALVFTNVRSQAERVALEMGLADGVTEELHTSRASDRRIGVHHSALERSVRHRVEEDLRAGRLHAVVCSSSLELGVDIGYIDRVVLIGGARGATSTLQRVGRAGHRPDAIAEGLVIAQDRDDIVEAAATRRCIADGRIEEIVVPDAPLDVLAQWMVMSVCYDKRIALDDLLARARRALPYAGLKRDDLVRCARYLSGGGIGDDAAHALRLGFDGSAIFGLGREVCAAYFDNVGTIPDEKHAIVRMAGGGDVGRVEEGFVNELRIGEIFVLDGRTLRVKEIGSRGVTVEAFVGRPTIPQWSSHMKGIGPDLAREICDLRIGVARRIPDGVRVALDWLRERYGLDGTEASHVVRYIAQQRAISAIPEPDRPVVEIYVMDRKQVAVFHTCAGRRINETLARGVGARVRAALGVETSLTTDDNGFLITLPFGALLPDARWAQMLVPSGFESDVRAGIRSSHLLRNYFRYVANTGLLVLRRAAGRTLRRGTQSWNSARILEQVARRDPEFPLLRETWRAVTHDLLDLPGTLAYVASLDGEPRILHPPAASPFTFGIVTSSFGDAVVMDDRTAMVEALHDRVLQLLGDADMGAPADGRPQLELRYS